jgi:zinc protease
MNPHSGPTTFRLANGLAAVFEPSPLSPVVAIQAWVKAGAGDEPVAKAGIAHLVEHMLFKGTRRRRVGSVAREIESAGGEINAWTSHDETAYHVVLPNQALALGIDVLADVLQESSFDPQEFAREKKVVLEEVLQGLDDPDRMAGIGLFATAWQQHPYGRAVIGQAETVSALTRADVLAHYRRQYCARNTTVVVTGDFDPAVARRLVERAFARMPAGKPCPPRPLEPPQRSPRVSAFVRDVRESQLLLAWRGPRVDDDDVPALDLLAVALGQGESSRLHLALVRGRALLQSASSYLFSGRDPGLVILSASLVSGRGDRAASALRAILGEIERLVRSDLTPDELARSRTILESQRVFDRESTQGLARKLAFFACTVGDVDFEDRYMRRLAEVSARDVRLAAAKYLRPEALSVYAQLEGKPGTKTGTKTKGTDKPGKATADPATTRGLTQVVASFLSRTPRVVAPEALSRGAAAEVISQRLGNGLRLLTLRDPSLPLVALRAAWVGGLRHEDAPSSGSSSLVAALLTRGTRGHDAEAIIRQVEGMAGSLSGHAGRNSLGLEAEFLSRHLDVGLELFAECLVAPTFPESELAHERRLALEALRQQEDDISHVAFRTFERALFRDHPYGLDLIGSTTSLPRLGRARLQRFYREHYSPGELTIAAVGDVDPGELARRMEALFPADSGRRSSGPPRPRTPRPRPEPRLELREMAREQAHLVLGFPGVTLDDPDRYPLEILAQLLSGQGGRLFVEIREKRGLAYSVGAFSLEGLDPGYFAVHAATSPEHVPTVLASIRRELARIMDRGVPAADVRRVQRHLVGGHAIGLQRRSALAAVLALHEAYGLGWQNHRNYARDIQAVQVADLLRVARKYWDPAREVVTVVGPKNALAALGSGRSAFVAQ